MKKKLKAIKNLKDIDSSNEYNESLSEIIDKPIKRRKGAVKNEISKNQLSEIYEAFDCFKDEGLDINDLKNAMKVLNLNPENPEIKLIYEKLDDINKDKLTFDDYYNVIFKSNITDPKIQMKKVFDKFKENEDDDFISFKGLKNICKNIGEQISDSELQDMIEEADIDQDGKVNFNDFLKVMIKSKVI